MRRSRFLVEERMTRGLFIPDGNGFPASDFLFDPATFEVDYGNFNDNDLLNGTVTDWRNTGVRTGDDFVFRNAANNDVRWIESINATGLPGVRYVNQTGPGGSGSGWYPDESFIDDVFKCNAGANGGDTNEEFTLMFPFRAATGLTATTGSSTDTIGNRDVGPAPDEGWFIREHGTGGTPARVLRFIWSAPAGLGSVDTNRTWAVDVWEIAAFRLRKNAANDWQVTSCLSQLVSSGATGASFDFLAVQAAQAGPINTMMLGGDGDLGGRASFDQGECSFWGSALSDAEFDAAITDMANRYGVTIV